MRQPQGPGPGQAMRLPWQRRHLLPLLVVAFGLVPFLLVLDRTSAHGNEDVVAAGSLLLLVTAALQVRGLTGFVGGLLKGEQALRDASTALSAASGREAITSAALDAMPALTGSRDARAWFVPYPWTAGVLTARSSDGAEVPIRAEELVSAAPADRTVPHVVAPGGALHRALGVLDRRVVVVVPVAIAGQPQALGMVALSRPPRDSTLGSLATYADMLSLALDRVDLADVHGERRTERRMRSMVQHSSDVIALLDADLTLCYVTPAVEQVLGHPPLELVGQRWLDLVSADDREAARDLVLRASSGRAAHTEIRMQTADGRTCLMDTTVTEVDEEEHAGFVLTCHDVTERRALETELEHQAFHDALTGLANRALFHDRVGHALSRTRRAGTSCAVLFLDLDDFKTVNDSLGHAAGDALLAEVTTRVRACLRDGDTAARLGGDEFAVLLEDVQDDTCTTIAGRLISSLRQPYDLGGAEVTPTASIGIAVAGSSEISTDDLLRNADLAMYEAKKAGKARWMLFAPEMHDSAVERLVLTGDLRQGLARGEITVHYQPVYDLADARIVGFEALVRWEHPTRGMLPPGRFIPIAEDTGLIHELGSRVLDTALADAARWQRLPERADLRIAVNVSGRQLQDGDVVDVLADLLRRHDVRPDTVVLEFTESVLLPGDKATLDHIEALSALGVRLYIDDFGTGYSSLSYLQQLPVNGMKLAQEFVRGLPGTETESGLVRAILDLAEKLGLDAVVAEGVERGEQLEALVALGYGMGQGFHLGTPQPASSVELLLGGSMATVPTQSGPAAPSVPAPGPPS